MNTLAYWDKLGVSRQSLSAILFGAVCAVSIATPFCSSSAAQDSTDRSNAIYRHFANVPTEVPGIYTYPAPPASFNAIAAADEELAMYGFPPRPDAATRPRAYESWARTVALLKNRWNGPLTVSKYQSTPRPPKKSAPPLVNDQVPSVNDVWSGFSNFKNVSEFTTKGPNSSFYSATANFTVPVVEDAYGETGCAALGTNGAAFVSVGIDNPSLMGGVLATNPGWVNDGGCDVFPPTYYAVVGAGTSANLILEFPVSPGDTMNVTVWATSATTGNVLVGDYTHPGGATYAITTNPILADEADFLIEKVCCEASGNPVQIPNYVQDFWGLAYAEDYQKRLYGPGTNTLNSPTYRYTYDWIMTDNTGAEEVSYGVPYTYPFWTSTDLFYAVQFWVENCAQNYGCANQ